MSIIKKINSTYGCMYVQFHMCNFTINSYRRSDKKFLNLNEMKICPKIVYAELFFLWLAFI